MKFYIKVKRKQALFCAAAIPVFFCCAVWGAGSFLSRPAKHSIGALPANLQGRDVQFESGSGSELRGWLIPGRKGAGAVVLMHGFRGDRRQMLARASFLSEAGYGVLLFDFQAHGESPGNQITIGYLESRDAQDAVEFMKKNNHGEKLGVIGLSMGGAAAILASPALEVEAIVLEAVYPDIERAVANRVERYLGAWARGLGRLLIMQLPLRAGIEKEALRPIDRVGAIKAPKLFIAGAKDQHTKLDESREIFAAASEPKEL